MNNVSSNQGYAKLLLVSLDSLTDSLPCLMLSGDERGYSHGHAPTHTLHSVVHAKRKECKFKRNLLSRPDGGVGGRGLTERGDRRFIRDFTQHLETKPSILQCISITLSTNLF